MILKKPIGRTSHPSNAALIQPNITNINTWTNPENTEDKMLAERVLDDMAITCLPSAFMPGSYSAESARRDLEFLNRKLDSVRKTVTAWDTYNILGVANNLEEVNIWLNTLTPNSSFIINTEIIDNDNKLNKKYSVGDVVFKDLNGNINIIKAQNSGIYFPQTLEPFPQTLEPIEGNNNNNNNGNSYKLTYTFTSDMPLSGTAKMSTSDEETEEKPLAHEQMIGEVTVKSELYPYKIHKILTPQDPSYSIDLISNVQPVINLFLNGEKVWLDEGYIQTENQIIITNTTGYDLLLEVR